MLLRIITHHDPEFATSPICIKDKDFDFSVDLSLISNVETDPFYGTENDNAIEHMNKFASLSACFLMTRRYKVTI